MTEQIILNADARERTGSNKARVIRKVDGMVPAIVYGDEKETLNIKLKLNELTKASENELFYTQVLLIKTGDNEEKVVLKELQSCLLYTSPSPRDQRGSGMAACA